MSSIKRLLIVEDDEAFARVLVRSFERRGYEVRHASGYDAMLALMNNFQPSHAVCDLKLGGSKTGLDCVRTLVEMDSSILIVVLTGFASINTAVEAVKLGACQYLAKPANTDEIEAAFEHVAGQTQVQITNRQTDIKTLEWERIHEVLVQTDFNISEAARRLGMHRRTLARKLEKRRV